MTDAGQAPRARRDRNPLWIIAATLTAIVASIAPWGTIGRLTVAVMFAVAAVALVHQYGRPGRRAWTLGAAVAFAIVSWLQVVLTSPSVAWAVDSHMVPWLPLPGATPRIVLAWCCALGWTALVTTAASQIPSMRSRPAATMLFGLTALLPLLNPDAFPSDGYELLWNRSTFTHPAYTLALLAFLATTAALHPGPRRPDEGLRPNGQMPTVSASGPR